MIAARKVRRPLTLLLILVGVAMIGGLVSPWAPEQIDWEHITMAPGTAGHHWFGTDRLGRDLWARLCAGLRLSLVTTLVASAISVALGTTVGLIAGYARRGVDELLMHLVDGLYALPYVLLVIIVTTRVGTGPGSLALAMATIGWLPLARATRDETRRLRSAPFIEAAIVMGLPPWTILSRHLLPNLGGLLLVQTALLAPQFILLESFLSFLGLGMTEPAASLGNLLSQGAQSLEVAPWLELLPASTLVLLVTSLMRLGEAYRDDHDAAAA